MIIFLRVFLSKHDGKLPWPIHSLSQMIEPNFQIDRIIRFVLMKKNMSSSNIYYKLDKKYLSKNQINRQSNDQVKREACQKLL